MNRSRKLNAKRRGNERAAERVRKYSEHSSDSDGSEGNHFSMSKPLLKSTRPENEESSFLSPAKELFAELPLAKGISRKREKRGQFTKSISEELLNTPKQDSAAAKVLKSPFPQTLPQGAFFSPQASSVLPSSASFFVPIPTLPTAISPTPVSSRVLSQDAIATTIFQCLFDSQESPRNEVRSRARRCRLWDDVDSSSDEEEDGGGSNPLPKVQPVDELWFKRLCCTELLTSSALDFAVARSASCEEFELSNYVGASFVSSLIKELPFEDDRFTSPRVSVLKAIYRNCSSALSPLRRKIVTALVEACLTRAERCKESVNLARFLEIEANEAANSGLLYSGDLSVVSEGLVRSVNSSSGLPGRWGGGKEEKTGVKVRDNASTILELLSYTVAVELKEIKDRMMTSVDGMAGASQEGIDLAVLGIICLQMQVAVNVLSCYGGSLGLPKGGESADEPAMLENIVSSLSNIMLVAENISCRTVANYCRSSLEPSRDSKESAIAEALAPVKKDVSSSQASSAASRVRNRSVSRPSFTRTNSVGTGVCCIVTLGPTAASWLAEELIRLLIRLWPGNNRFGAGYHCEIAFLKVAELALTNSLPFSPSSLLRRAEAIRNREPIASTSHAVTELSKSIEPALPRLQASAPQMKCLQKVVHSLRSNHFKVALQAFGVINNPRILSKYFVNVDPHNCLESLKHNIVVTLAGVNFPIVRDHHTEVAILLSQESSSATHEDDAATNHSTGLSPLGVHAFAELLAEERSSILNVLVQTLRNNRAHWHPQVLGSSNLLFDWLLDYLD